MSNTLSDEYPPYYMTLSLEEAKKKVEDSIENISEESGIDCDEFFLKILGK